MKIADRCWDIGYRAYNKSLRLYHRFHPKQVSPGQTKSIPLAIASMFQNEGRFLREWIEFHRLLGVEKFYLYNNRSGDDFAQVLSPYIQSGLVELFDWPYDTRLERRQVQAQVHAYRDALDRARGDVEWLALMDLDEFLFPTKENDLPTFLQKYRSHAALSVCWQQYGTSDVEEIASNELLIERLVRKAPTEWEGNRLVKTVVQPEYVTRCVDVHFCHLCWGYLQVDEQKRSFQGFEVPVPTVEQIRINHYWTRDKKFMREVKAKRKDGWAQKLYEERKDLLNAEEDSAILRFLPLLKREKNHAATGP